MENDIIDALNNIGYNGPMLESKYLMNAVSGGPKNVDYTEVVNYLTNELRELCCIDECVNPIKNPEDSSHFLLELSSFLRELQCPFHNLTQGHVTDRLSTEYDKLLLLDYLVSELMAARMVEINKPDQKMELKIHESSNANNLKQILLALKFNKPPANITPAVLFQKVEPKVEETVKRAGGELCGQPLFRHSLSEAEWERLGQVESELNADYTIRREMLLKRLDCTIQSFQWSDKVKGQEDKIVQIFVNKRKQLKVDPDIDISDLLAARNDLAIIEKTSNTRVRKNTQTALTKHIIGPVPDRGGRPSEQQPPPPEMPSWQQRSSGSSGGGGGGRGRGRGGGDNFQRGGRGGDNYSRGGGRGGGNQGYNQNANYSQSYDSRVGYDNRGSYSDNRGGYDNYQVNKTSYAEQYVQEAQSNQQFRAGNNYNSGRGQNRGRSNYNRGNYR